MDLSLDSPKLGTSNTPEGKMRDILRDLEEIRKKLRENFTGKEPLEDQRQGKLILFGRGGSNMEVGGKWQSVPWLCFWGTWSQGPAAVSPWCSKWRSGLRCWCGWLWFWTWLGVWCNPGPWRDRNSFPKTYTSRTWTWFCQLTTPLCNPSEEIQK